METKLIRQWAVAIALGLCVALFVDVAAAQPGPVLLEQQRGGVASAAPRTIPPGHLLDLIDLKALPKLLYSWYVDPDVLAHPPNRDHLVQCARITGSLGVNFWYSNAELMLAAGIATEAGVGVTLNTMPWHVTGCNGDPLDWTKAGQEMARLQEFFVRTLRLGLRVDAITLDSECYKRKHPLATTRLDMVFALVKTYYPTTPVYWFGNGQLPYQFDVKCDNRTAILYATYDASQTEDIVNAMAERFPGEPLAVWITLGPGYRQGWQWDLDLDPLHYWYLGRFLAGDARVKVPILYPGFYRSYTPGFHDAFVAFVRGMTGEPYRQPHP